LASSPEAQSSGIRTAVGTLGKQGDVHIPISLLQHAKWPEGQSNVSLVAQWIGPGRLRLHLQSTMHDELEARRTRITDEESEEMAAFLDTYREAKLYFSKTQVEKYNVKLQAETASHLQISREGDREIYLEARDGVIDILSPACRNKRLSDFAAT